MIQTKEKLNAPLNSETTNGRSSAGHIPAEATKLSPLVYWAQTETLITLKVELKDAAALRVNFGTNSIHFQGNGVGARGNHKYSFDLNFYEAINEDECTYREFDSKIEIVMQKSVQGWWPRLVATPQKPHWLKIDFDRWRSEEDDLDEKPRDIMEDYSHEYERLQKQEFGYIKESTKKVYMIFYNLVQFIGFLYILIVMAILYMRDGTACMPKTYASVGGVMKFCQLLQYLEVLHPIFGYTKGNALMPFFQVTGRNFVLFIMIELEPRMQTKPVVFYVFLLWSLIEIFRYSYYISQLLNRDFGLLTWLRYTIWIPLYPMGIVCEGIIILRNIPYFEQTKLFSVDLPNKWNISFDMPFFLKIYLFLLILPGAYFLMSHMAKARAKKLGHDKRRRRQHLD